MAFPTHSVGPVIVSDGRARRIRKLVAKLIRG